MWYVLIQKIINWKQWDDEKNSKMIDIACGGDKFLRNIFWKVFLLFKKSENSHFSSCSSEHIHTQVVSKAGEHESN